MCIVWYITKYVNRTAESDCLPRPRPAGAGGPVHPVRAQGATSRRRSATSGRSRTHSCTASPPAWRVSGCSARSARRAGVDVASSRSRRPASMLSARGSADRRGSRRSCATPDSCSSSSPISDPPRHAARSPPSSWRSTAQSSASTKKISASGEDLAMRVRDIAPPSAGTGKPCGWACSTNAPQWTSGRASLEAPVFPKKPRPGHAPRMMGPESPGELYRRRSWRSRGERPAALQARRPT